MTRDEIQSITEKIYNNIVDRYGESKYHNNTPYISIEDSPYSDEEAAPDQFGEYCRMLNEITIYWKNMDSLEILARTLIHEYQHYLQSPKWIKRYYNMGYVYNDHPYEISARNEEENWLKVLNGI
jgi:hypothetical protein